MAPAYSLLGALLDFHGKLSDGKSASRCSTTTRTFARVVVPYQPSG